MSDGGRDPSASLPLHWSCIFFDELSARELQNIYMARQRVFVLEQRCAFIDADGLDEHAHHLAAWARLEREPQAYARLLAPGAKYDEPSIGRVLTAAGVRGLGVGRELMLRALAHAAELWPSTSVRISAQSRLEAFYASMGFVAQGERYMEDGIEHTEMLRSSPASD